MVRTQIYLTEAERAVLNRLLKNQRNQAVFSVSERFRHPYDREILG